MQKIIIRNENKEDYRAVEELTRKAFWNLQIPGCNEHYLVHVLRKHADFVPQLDFVLEVDGAVVANIMYTISKLIDESGKEKRILTFGPLAVLPEYQRKGYGKMLLEHSCKEAVRLGYDAIVIFGNPENYVCNGFKSCHKFNVSIGDKVFPTAMLVKELIEGSLGGKKWSYHDSAAYQINDADSEEFDKSFEPLTKEYKATQELFYIYSRSRIVEEQ